MSLHRFDVRRVVGRLSSGSSSPVVVETDGGRFVAKLRGAGHGVLALVAEIIVGELAEAVGLAVPERVLLELPPDVPSDDANDELGDLLQRSIGTSLGLRFLDGAREPRAAELGALEDEFAVRVLLLDELVMNPDRTHANPNILFWRGRPWLIDHGAALVFHYDWSSVTQSSPLERMDFSKHVFADRRAVVERFRPDFVERITREALARATAYVPDAFLDPAVFGSFARVRAAYEAFLWQRLKL